MAVIAAATSLGGCNTASLPSLGSPGQPTRVSASSTEVYVRIAQGANACWFGPQGPLRTTHIFHADVEPVHGTGTAEIIVHERDATQPKPWGRRAFRIALTPVGEQTSIDVENLAMPAEAADRMRADVFQWVEGGSGCRMAELATPARGPAASGQTPAKKPATTKPQTAK